MSTISELCRGLVETNKTESYNLIDRLIRLILTLLNDSLVVYIEREITEAIDTDSVIDAFCSSKDRRVQFH